MSPFEQPQIQYRIKAPIFVLRQLMRHRAGHWNEISARYTEVEDCEVYYPDVWRIQSEKNKQSSVASPTGKQPFDALYSSSIEVSFRKYKELIRLGCAREMARMVLPVASYSEVIVTFDLRNLLNVFDQRIHEGAQWETQQVAIAMKDLIMDIFPWTFEYYGNV